ncbi:hypothetical protein V8B97DRAFT_1950433, partial [Scleroderma yunnanense]
ILPLIPWDTDDHALMWRLIAEITKPANLKVLCGKLKHEVSNMLNDEKLFTMMIIHSEHFR